MEWIEVTARSVAEAVDAALDRLGVDEEDMEYEVLLGMRQGFFGRLGGAPGVRIRARVRPISREKPVRRGGSGRSAGEGQSKGTAPASTSGFQARAVPRPEVEARHLDTRGEGEGQKRGDSGVKAPRKHRRRARNRASGGSGAVLATTRPADGEERAMSGFEVPLESQIELARDFTVGLVERFGLAAAVTVAAEGDEGVRVEITGSDLGLLIGPRAATLDALQELVRTAVQRRIGGFGARIGVDVAGYRARRQQALAEVVREAAKRAVESGRDQVFEVMSAADRKVVHDTVNEIDGVATVSEGEEPRRRVVIKVL